MKENKYFQSCHINKKMCSSFLFWIFYTNVFLLLSAMLRVNASITMCVDSGMLVSAVIFIRIDNAWSPLKNYVRSECEKNGQNQTHLIKLAMI